MELEERRLQEGQWHQGVTVVRPSSAGLGFHLELHAAYHQPTGCLRPRGGQDRPGHGKMRRVWGKTAPAA
jgi:hypothetical protein